MVVNEKETTVLDQYIYGHSKDLYDAKNKNYRFNRVDTILGKGATTPP